MKNESLRVVDFYGSPISRICIIFGTKVVSETSRPEIISTNCTLISKGQIKVQEKKRCIIKASVLLLSFHRKFEVIFISLIKIWQVRLGQTGPDFAI